MTLWKNLNAEKIAEPAVLLHPSHLPSLECLTANLRVSRASIWIVNCAAKYSITQSVRKCAPLYSHQQKCAAPAAKVRWNIWQSWKKWPPQKKIQLRHKIFHTHHFKVVIKQVLHLFFKQFSTGTAPRMGDIRYAVVENHWRDIFICWW